MRISRLVEHSQQFGLIQAKLLGHLLSPGLDDVIGGQILGLQDKVLVPPALLHVV